jgi:hypothetical protein
VLLISRQEIANRASTKLKLVSAPGFGLDLATLAWWLDCPQSQIEFSRVGPIELVHGGAWARSRMLESLRWPYLGQCVIHGRAIGLRLGLPGPVPIRGLTDWEAANAHACFQRLAAPLIQGDCPLDGALLETMPIHQRQAFCSADESGKLAIRQALLAERSAQQQERKAVLTSKALQSRRP